MTTRQRTPRLLDSDFLDYVREQPCCICGRQAEAAHIRLACNKRDKRHSGIGERPDDKWSTPLCPDHHRNGKASQHEIGSERKFWQSHGLDPFVIAEKLYAEFAAIRTKPAPEPVMIRKRKRKPPMGDREREAMSRSLRQAWACGRSRWPKGRKIQNRPLRK